MIYKKYEPLTASIRGSYIIDDIWLQDRMPFIMQFRYSVCVGFHVERGSCNALLMRHSGDLLHCGISPQTQTPHVSSVAYHEKKLMFYISFYEKIHIPKSILYLRGRHLGDILKVQDRT